MFGHIYSQKELLHKFESVWVTQILSDSWKPSNCYRVKEYIIIVKGSVTSSVISSPWQVYGSFLSNYNTQVLVWWIELQKQVEIN